MSAARSRRRSAVLASERELWGALPPRQARSVDLIERVARAAERLLAERDYDDVSVADIAALAGVSVGAFYTRFPSKDHVVIHLVGGLADELVDLMAREMDPSRLAGRPLGAIIHRYLTMTGNAFLRHRGVMRPATLVARQTQNAHLRQLLARFNAEVHGRFRTLLRSRLQEEGRDVPSDRLDIAMLWSSAALREVMLYGEPVSRLTGRHERLIDELTRSFVRTLEEADDDA